MGRKLLREGDNLLGVLLVAAGIAALLLEAKPTFQSIVIISFGTFCYLASAFQTRKLKPKPRG